jgi:tetratricopeptide (TPR) repeat protein
MIQRPGFVQEFVAAIRGTIAGLNSKAGRVVIVNKVLPSNKGRAWLTVIALIWCACSDLSGQRERGDPPGVNWDTAQAMWRDRDVRSHAAWRAIDPLTPDGQTARRHLGEADRHYRAAIRLFGQGEPEAAVQAFEKGIRIGPIDPGYYFPLAETCFKEGWDESAAKYYRKYLEALPGGPDDTNRKLPRVGRWKQFRAQARE